MCARRGSRRRSPEIRAGLEALKRDLAPTLAPRGRWGDNGPMVSRLLDLADRHVAARRLSGPPVGQPPVRPSGQPPEPGDAPAPPEP